MTDKKDFATIMGEAAAAAKASGLRDPVRQVNWDKLREKMEEVRGIDPALIHVSWWRRIAFRLRRLF